MTPGSAAQPPDDVVSVSWNKQGRSVISIHYKRSFKFNIYLYIFYFIFLFSVQHILTTTFPARCMVWDLRKNEPIIKLSDSTARV